MTSLQQQQTRVNSQSHRINDQLSILSSTPTNGSHAHSGTSSEWILFSPLSNNYSDVLSQADSRELESSSIHDDLDDNRENDSEEEDSLWNEIHNASLTSTHMHEVTLRNELENRIDLWRREQITMLLGELSECYYQPREESTGNFVISKIDKFYGDCVIRGFNKEQLKAVRKVIDNLSTSLERDLSSRDIVFNKGSEHREKSKRNTRKIMNNPDLEKYVPLYWRKIIMESNLLPDFQDNDENYEDGTLGDEDDDTETRTSDTINEGMDLSGDNFWEINTISSIVTYSNGSILGF